MQSLTWLIFPSCFLIGLAPLAVELYKVLLWASKNANEPWLPNSLEQVVRWLYRSVNRWGTVALWFIFWVLTGFFLSSPIDG